MNEIRWLYFQIRVCSDSRKSLTRRLCLEKSSSAKVLCFNIDLVGVEGLMADFDIIELYIVSGNDGD